MKKSIFITTAIVVLVSLTTTVLYHFLYELENIVPTSEKQKNKKVLIVPLNDNIEQSYVDSACSYLQHYFPLVQVELADVIDIPNNCHNGRRYRADSILKFLDKLYTSEYYRVIGLTNDDISNTRTLIENGKEVVYPDRGIIGLGQRPGRVCVVSKYRLGNDIYSFAKVTTHEFMHTLGVPHCAHEKCIMQDGNGSTKPLRESNHIHQECLDIAYKTIIK